MKHRMRAPTPHVVRRIRSREERGQTLVEFALVLPLLGLLIFGIIQFGILFYTYIDLTSAAREGARKASVSRTDANAIKTVKATIAAATSVVDDTADTITVTPAQPWTSGQDVEVKVTYPYSLNIMGVVIWNGTLTGDAVARVE